MFDECTFNESPRLTMAVIRTKLSRLVFLKNWYFSRREHAYHIARLAQTRETKRTTRRVARHCRPATSCARCRSKDARAIEHSPPPPRPPTRVVAPREIARYVMFLSLRREWKYSFYPNSECKYTISLLGRSLRKIAYNTRPIIPYFSTYSSLVTTISSFLKITWDKTQNKLQKYR